MWTMYINILVIRKLTVDLDFIVAIINYIKLETCNILEVSFMLLLFCCSCDKLIWLQIVMELGNLLISKKCKIVF
jgi:hypothetical protein